MKKVILYNAKHILYIIYILSIISCKNNDYKNSIADLKSVVNNTLGNKLMIPDSLFLYKPFLNLAMDSVEIANAEFKVYSLINSSCGTCIDGITKWNKLSIEFNKYKIPIILICESNDDFELLRYFCDIGQISKFPFPFFLNKMSNYSRVNKFMEKSDNFKTVLTDRNNNILLMGNPILSKGMKDLYINEIEKRLRKSDNKE